MKFALALMAFDRPAYFRAAMAHWSDVRGFHRWNPTVRVEPSPHQAEIIAMAAASEVPAILNPRRYGVLSHPWQILEDLFERVGADFAVIGEDDVLVANDTLDYFSWAARRFADQRVLAVCGTSHAPNCPPGQEHRVYLTPSFTPMLWGTWADRWRTTLRDTWDHDYGSGTAERPESGWDWNINLRIIPAGDWLCAHPVASRSDHIGRHGGMHTNEFSFPGSVSATFQAAYPPGRFHTEDSACGR